MAIGKKVALGSDHSGFEFKEKIKSILANLGFVFTDYGAFSSEPSDYPDFAHRVAEKVSNGKVDYGILICGTGIGMSITANKHKNVRAAVVESVEMAKLARQHNDVNVLAIGARITPWERIEEIIKTFLSTEFEGGRHKDRIDKLHFLTNL